MGVSNYTPTGISHATSVDFSKRSVNQPVHIVQYDRTLPILAVSLYNNGQLYRLSETMDVSIRLGKPDRTFVYNKALGCDSTRTIVYFEITQQMSLFDGEYYPVIEIMDGDKIANSSTIYLVVDRNPVQHDYIESTIEYKELIDYRDEAVKAGKEAKESAKISSDSAKTSLEKAKEAVEASETAVNAANSASESAESILGVEENVTRIGNMVSEKEPIITEAAEVASTSATNARQSETNAKASEEASKLSETNARQSETNAKASEEASKLSETNAEASETKAKASEEASKLSETNAKESADSAKVSADNIEEIAKASESYAHGGTGTREGEDTDNARYYMEQAKAVSTVDVATTDKAGIVKPDGTTITVDEDGTLHGVAEVTVDDAMSSTSTNPVQNKVVKNYIDNGVNSSKKLQTYKAGSTTETYGDAYTMYAQWIENNHLKIKCDNYIVETDYATYADDAARVNGHTVNSDVPSGAKFTDTVYDDTGIQNEINTLKKSVSDGKTKVANAITDKGVETATDATFDVMAENISKIETGVHGATLAVSTTDSVLFGQTVTLTLNGASVGSTVFADNGTCSFVVQNPGTYTITCGEAHDDVTVTGDNVVNKTVISVDLSLIKIVTFADGTDEEISAMIQAHYNDKINIADYWAVGDMRTVSLSAMSAIGVRESHRAQTVQFVIGDFNHDDLTTPINGHSKAAVTILQKDCLMDASNASNPVNGEHNTENGYMNIIDSNAGGWKNCARRTWCNNVFFAALPIAWQLMVKTVNKRSGTGGGSSSGTEITADKIFLAAEIEIFGSKTLSFAGEGTQYQYYKNATANRHKMPKWSSSNVSNVYWERSPYSGGTYSFCRVDNGGDFDANAASLAYGVAPCLCI